MWARRHRPKLGRRLLIAGNPTENGRCLPRSRRNTRSIRIDCRCTISIHLLGQRSDLQCIFESTNYNFTKGLLPCSYSPSASIFSVEIGPASETRTPRLARRTASRRAGERQLQALPLVIDQTHFQMSSPQCSSVRRFLIAYGQPHKSAVSSNSTRSAIESFSVAIPPRDDRNPGLRVRFRTLCGSGETRRTAGSADLRLVLSAENQIRGHDENGPDAVEFGDRDRLRSA